MQYFLKMSFLLLCISGILMAPLSTAAYAYMTKPAKSFDHAMKGHAASAQSHAATDMQSPSPNSDCCNDGKDNCAHKAPMAPGACDTCDAACQNTCTPHSALLKQAELGRQRSTQATHKLPGFLSLLAHWPEALNPPPRA